MELVSALGLRELRDYFFVVYESRIHHDGVTAKKELVGFSSMRGKDKREGLSFIEIRCQVTKPYVHVDDDERTIVINSLPYQPWNLCLARPSTPDDCMMHEGVAGKGEGDG